MIYINENTVELDITSALPEVSAQRREQALKFRHEKGRRLSLAVYLLLKKGLREEFGITENPVFGYSPEGKPFLPDHPDIHFSFSHSGSVALCAIDRVPVGADVEVPRTITPELTTYTMNGEEVSRITASEVPQIAFLSLWTKKEAVLKLTGEGIRNNMKNVLTDCGQVSPSVITAAYPDAAYVLALFRTSRLGPALAEAEKAVGVEGFTSFEKAVRACLDGFMDEAKYTGFGEKVLIRYLYQIEEQGT